MPKRSLSPLGRALVEKIRSGAASEAPRADRAGATPLAPKGRVSPPSEERVTVRPKPAVVFEVTDDGLHLEGRRVGMPAAVVSRLGRGDLPVRARLDLHGQGLTDARQLLEDFLARAERAGQFVVLVIHGRGRHSPDGRSAIRAELADWLTGASCSARVLAFASAPLEHGGGGATYVMLRQPDRVGAP
jgi:DNA-nicking Smr family endonuclease